MNKKQLAIMRNNVAREFRTPSTHQPRPRNAIFLNPSNSFKHELGKVVLCWELLKQGKQFLTEAVEIKSGKRRDVVCLDDALVYELETSPKRAERHIEDWVVVVPLWGVKDVSNVSEIRKRICEVLY